MKFKGAATKLKALPAFLQAKEAAASTSKFDAAKAPVKKLEEKEFIKRTAGGFVMGDKPIEERDERMKKKLW